MGALGGYVHGTGSRGWFRVAPTNPVSEVLSFMSREGAKEIIVHGESDDGRLMTNVNLKLEIVFKGVAGTIGGRRSNKDLA